VILQGRRKNYLFKLTISGLIINESGLEGAEEEETIEQDEHREHKGLGGPQRREKKI